MKKIKVEVSARHLHVTQEDLEALFGEDYVLESKKSLSQKGEFASNALVKLVGPKSEMENVRIVGPVRSYTQVELSRTDCFNIGIKAPLRLSGKIEGSGKVKVVGPAGELDLEKGVIIAKRHIHLAEHEAHEFGVKNGQEVKVAIDSARSLVFEKVEIRVKESFSASLHIDTDEGNAAFIDAEIDAEILI